MSRRTRNIKTRWRVLEVFSYRDENTRHIAGLIHAAKPEEIPEGYVATTARCIKCDRTILEVNRVVPRDVARDVEEGLLCLSVRAHNAATVMFRRAIQTSAGARGAVGDRLAAQLQHLEKVGKLTGGTRDWTRAARHLGNRGAHPEKDRRKQLERERAEGSLLVMLAYLQAVYIEPPCEYVEEELFDEFEARHTWWGEECVHGLTRSHAQR